MSDSFSLNHLESVQILAQKLIDQQLKLATAESCTGGMLAEYLTAISGSSMWFECGFVTYSNDSKISLLGVQAKVLDEYSAVSSEVAEQMALGALRNSLADLTVSITGIAGPKGGSEKKPVGSVYIATARSNLDATVCHYQFEGNRDAIRQQTTQAAIRLMIDQLS